MHVRYLDEFKWVEHLSGTRFDFQDDAGESVADVAVHDSELKLWKWEVRVPERYQFNGVKPCGLIVGSLPAKRVCELILSNTFLLRQAGMSSPMVR